MKEIIIPDDQAAGEATGSPPHTQCVSVLRAAARSSRSGGGPVSRPYTDTTGALVGNTSHHPVPSSAVPRADSAHQAQSPSGWEIVHRWARKRRCVGRARAELRKALVRWELVAIEDAALVVLSELLTNAVRHADVPPDHLIETRYRRTGHGVHIEVHDASETWPTQRTPAADDDDGRGLLLVDTLADRWGVSERKGIGKRVWAEVTVHMPDHQEPQRMSCAVDLPDGDGR